MAIDAVSRAREIGREHGKNAASWVFDGNTTRETYAKVLAGIDDGDPLVMDAYRVPSLSGEFGDDYSEQDLANEALDDDECSECGHSFTTPLDAETCQHCQGHAEFLTELADAYNDGASGEFWAELERTARKQLED